MIYNGRVGAAHENLGTGPSAKVTKRTIAYSCSLAGAHLPTRAMIPLSFSVLQRISGKLSLAYRFYGRIFQSGAAGLLYSARSVIVGVDLPSELAQTPKRVIDKRIQIVASILSADRLAAKIYLFCLFYFILFFY